MTQLVVCVHDVSPATAEQTSQWCADAANLGVPVSLLVVAGPWRGMNLADSPDFGRMLRGQVMRGHEIVLHAWDHTDGTGGNPLRRAAGMAVAPGVAEFAALSEARARERLVEALGTLTAAGLRVEGFSPPGALASPGTVAAADRLRLRYLATRSGLLHLHNRHRRRRVARVALHPDDLSRRDRRERALRAIEAVLVAGGEVLTFGQVARR